MIRRPLAKVVVVRPAGRVVRPISVALMGGPGDLVALGMSACGEMIAAINTELPADIPGQSSARCAVAQMSRSASLETGMGTTVRLI